jgi:hypothetical protein
MLVHKSVRSDAPDWQCGMKGNPLKLKAACPTRSMKSAATRFQRPATACRTGGSMMRRCVGAVT